MNDEQIALVGVMQSAFEDEPENMPRYSINDLRRWLSMPDIKAHIEALTSTPETDQEEDSNA